MQGGWVYIVTNKPNGILYIGVTSDIRRRAWEHREGIVEGFTKRYGLKRLVYVEHHEEIEAAIQREKSLKRWARAWKVNLIVADNPDWSDLYDGLNYDSWMLGPSPSMTTEYWPLPTKKPPRCRDGFDVTQSDVIASSRCEVRSLYFKTTLRSGLRR